MRISDWSSDVCSSDLIGGGHAEYRAGTRHAERQISFGDRRPAATSGRIVADRDAESQRVGRFGDRVGQPQWFADAADHEFVPARSEEHTSELQSLMRISYAVFCLKKKNKHINKCT